MIECQNLSPPHPTGAPGAKPDFLFYRKSRFDIIVALRGDTPPSAGVVIGLLVYCAIVALRGDTPPTAGIPNNSTPHTPHPPSVHHKYVIFDVKS